MRCSSSSLLWNCPAESGAFFFGGFPTRASGEPPLAPCGIGPAVAQPATDRGYPPGAHQPPAWGCPVPWLTGASQQNQHPGSG